MRRATRAASTFPATRAVPVPTRSWSRRSAAALRSTCRPRLEGIDIGAGPLDPVPAGQRAGGRGLGREAQLVPRSTAPRGATTRSAWRSRTSARRRRAAQRPLLGDRRAGPQRDWPDFVAPEIDNDSGVAHCLTPDALERALDGEAGRGRGLRRLPHLLRRGRRRRRARRGRPRPGCRSSSTSPGARTSPSSELPANALSSGADVVLNSVHKLGGSLTQSAILHLGRRRGSTSASSTAR